MTAVAATLGPSWYWYFARATGLVSLVLLTVVLVLGILGPLRVSSTRWPRFAIDTVHRDLSLLAVAVIVIHVLVSVLDGFAPIGLIDAVVPFVSAYRPLWLGLGAVAFDLILALVLTSVVRRRLGYRSWRLVHWLAYASWPIAVLHGLGTGSDSTRGWALALTFGCVSVVALATIARLVRADSITEGWRTAGYVATIAAALVFFVFALVGPLSPHWAARAGTPAAVIAKASGSTR
jgi:predicted ferric reductase